MGLELVFGDNKKDDKFDRRIVERLEFDAGAGASEYRDHLRDMLA